MWLCVFHFQTDIYPGSKDEGFGRQLHRSVSMITQPLAEHLHSSEDRQHPHGGISLRRRTNSGEEQGSSVGYLFKESHRKLVDS